MTKRFIVIDTETYQVALYDKETNDFTLIDNKNKAIELCDLLNALHEENEQLQKDCTTLICHNQEYRKENEQLKQQIAELQYSKKMLRATNNDLELGIRNLRKSFDEFDNMRVKHIKFLQKRMQKHGISIYYNDDGDVE